VTSCPGLNPASEIRIKEISQLLNNRLEIKILSDEISLILNKTHTHTHTQKEI